MENLKEKLPIILAIILAVAICGFTYYFLCERNNIYYTQIDNTKITYISATDDMKYEYTLDCYSDGGNKKEIKFKTSRELRESAYLKLEVIPISGVHSWEEVEFSELPSKVQEKYSNVK